MGPWWVSRHSIDRKYIKAYVDRVGISEPKEDFEDRGALYML